MNRWRTASCPALPGPRAQDLAGGYPRRPVRRRQVERSIHHQAIPTATNHAPPPAGAVPWGGCCGQIWPAVVSGSLLYIISLVSSSSPSAVLFSSALFACPSFTSALLAPLAGRAPPTACQRARPAAGPGRHNFFPMCLDPRRSSRGAIAGISNSPPALLLLPRPAP
ncbi:hypothetical protein K491DRAFT_13657 [Lophiostoma macrostomum CBS 122681]|uniref:Uncharacterized protein n=1 Tax=Lophiostoma macrostomum CBS 122681 TaxID=1314788 RepID=A0A6A6TV61_9PLEO|nr:hypothetical protein K491DRAFT_13657 [Lophiostoma macrostomum CBS 122681]